MKKLIIIDTFGFFFRAYYALPPLKNSNGVSTGLLTGFVNFIERIRKYFDTDYIVFALDSKGHNFRHKLYKDYKGNRKPPPEDLIEQLNIAIDWILIMGFSSFSKIGFEADDIIATLAKFGENKKLKVQIISHDKDLYQLIRSDEITVFDPIGKIEINEEKCIEKFEINPKYFTTYQAILGDSADNIKGVKGVGKKGAVKLVNQFGDLYSIYNNLNNIDSKRTKQLLIESKDSAFLSLELVSLKNDVFEDFNLDDFIYEDKNYLTPLLDDFIKLEMKQAIKKIENEDVNKNLYIHKKTSLFFKSTLLDNPIELFKIIKQITKNEIVAFDIETTGLDRKNDKIVGFSFSFSEKEAFYVPILHRYLGVGNQILEKDAKQAIEELFKFNIVGQNLKFDLSFLYNQYNIKEYQPFADTIIMAWLLNPATRVGLDYLAKKFFNYNMKKFKDIVKKDQNFSNIDTEIATFYAGEDAWMTRALYFFLDKALDISSKELKKEAQNIEYPLINIILKMEDRGIKVDLNSLQTLENKIIIDLEKLTKDIYILANKEFNIKSTQQLGVVLFENLKLKSGRKTKTGFSTNEVVLQGLLGKHPIIEKILKYRELYKIISTYTKPLYIFGKKDKNSRISTSFIQTGTATGRLSSKEPNLQNIPVKSDIGGLVRKSFIPKDGYSFLSLDYSQIELRFLAHFSEDKILIDSFSNNEDIHLATAIKLFGKNDAKEKRYIAKTVNFGILYGMGSVKLSQKLNIPKEEAKDIISNYFKSFPTIKDYFSRVNQDMIELGYVETIFKRKRIFDYENANGLQKSSFLRESINTVLQGSSADLIKLAMIEVDRYIESEKLDAYMLLQVHDELILEVKDDIVDNLSKKLKYIMENILELKIPLSSSSKISKKW